METPSGSEVPPVINLILLSAESLAQLVSPVWLLLPIILVILLFLSALFSASENAFFSLQHVDIENIEKNKKNPTHQILTLLSKPGLLLATILVGNNMVNIAFVILSSLYIESSLSFTEYSWLKFPIKVLVVTFVLLVFGEIIPKTYATRYNKKVAIALTPFLLNFQKLFGFIIKPLSSSASYFDKKLNRFKETLSAEELTHAIDITTQSQLDSGEKSILKSIVNFGNTEARQIMQPRVDISAAEIEINFHELLNIVKKDGYSRIPVYSDTFDQIEGIIYTKDLLPYIHSPSDFNWKKLIKPAFFVPETKKIDDLLKDFQEKRVHIAIVTDEYGGKQGLVTMEDVLEEIFGEIHDEFDVKLEHFLKVNDTLFVVDAKMLINDFCRLSGIEESTFESVAEVAETIGGVVLEVAGEIPIKGQSVSLQNLKFTIESADKRKIKKVKIEVLS